MVADGKFGLSCATINKINAVFAGHPLVDQVIIYGSRAKGNYRLGSDIDLTIKGQSVTLSELMKIETELDDLLLPYKIDLSLLHKINDSEVLEHIRRVGAILYQRAPGS
ncbi:nucleotidyltransferase domain-containing protein [Geomonas sp.]|uniref:nucleotidyltransferase domain-containing protein n=1 Tax=Geomonas sp. TaxID=2651584 RepID=UPI002B48DF2B|nr:nucleotidyltransferase domain-containing protein [Geomonas sp.]HJV35041.1 nucleotidyltransferase domain-containing protein [Geomonas sp.]